MIPPSSDSNPKSPLLIWWVIWGAICMGLTVMYFVIRPTGGSESSTDLQYIPLVPLALSAVVRWIILPQFKQRSKAFPLFIVGLAMAEGSGLMAMFLVPSLGTHYFALALLGLAQFIPLFAANYEN